MKIDDATPVTFLGDSWLRGLPTLKIQIEMRLGLLVLAQGLVRFLLFLVPTSLKLPASTCEQIPPRSGSRRSRRRPSRGASSAFAG